MTKYTLDISGQAADTKITISTQGNGDYVTFNIQGVEVTITQDDFDDITDLVQYVAGEKVLTKSKLTLSLD